MRKIFKRKIFNTDFGTVQSLPDLGLTAPTAPATNAVAGNTGETTVATVQ